MRVMVAGGGGEVGRRLVPLLAARGHQVVATTRAPDKLDGLHALGAEPLLMDGLDAASTRAAMEQARPDVVVHQMTSLLGVTDFRNFDRSFLTTNRLRTEGTDNLLAAAQSCGVRRVVAQSYTGWPNGSEGARVHTENDPLIAQPAASQRQTLAAILHVESAVCGAPLLGVVLRYGSFYGHGASDPLLTMVRRRRVPIVGGGGGVWSWLHVDDAASATVAAIEVEATGVFNVCDDDPAPVSQWLPYLAGCIGAKPPMRVPVWLARPVAGEAVIRMVTSIRGSSNAKAKRVLGWQPRWSTWREGFRDGLLG